MGVTVASTLSTPTPMISDELRRQADFFLDVAELAKTVGRAAVDRPPVDRSIERAERPHAERVHAHVDDKVK